MSLILFYGEDETRPLMDRVDTFSEKIIKEKFGTNICDQ